MEGLWLQNRIPRRITPVPFIPPSGGKTGQRKIISENQKNFPENLKKKGKISSQYNTVSKYFKLPWYLVKPSNLHCWNCITPSQFISCFLFIFLIRYYQIVTCAARQSLLFAYNNPEYRGTYPNYRTLVKSRRQQMDSRSSACTF